ncbi:MAG: DUF563 domain-containing protein [Opitutales bacterium]
MIEKIYEHVRWRIRQGRDQRIHRQVYRPTLVADLPEVTFTEVFPAQVCNWPPVRNYGPEPVDFGEKLTQAFPSIGVISLKEAVVNLARGYVFDTQGHFLIEAAWGPWDETFFRQDSLERPIEYTLQGRTLSLLTEFGDINYGHFLMDSLGRLAILNEAGIRPESFDHILLPAFESAETRRLVEAAGIPAERIIRPGKELRYAAIEDLTLTSFPGVARCYPDWMPQYLRSLVPAAAPQQPQRKLYLIRKSRGGNAVNELEIQALVKRYGFECVDPMDLQPDTYRHFQEASHVIGLHGAALAAVIYCQPGAARMLEILPSLHQVCYYFTLAAASGVEPFHFGATSVVPPEARKTAQKNRASERFDVQVDIPSLEQALEVFTA